ncbi:MULTISPECIES: hypothetical protein [unclassified Streptomyces]|uniref:hypothetical protein n=1 Tax=unclassified Streptomyces TaxID=2593676 RepID=UPI00278BB3E1|nr:MULTISPECIES: hypothetical protein [unclassified Streptomyces]
MAAFSDDFNRPDSTDLGPGWVEVSGDWSIIGGRLAPDNSGGSTILRAATPMESSDNFSQFTIVATTAASQGVWCRGTATFSSGYLWRTNGSSWDLFAVSGGSFTMIGTYAVPVVPGDVAKVQAVGSVIKGFVNGIERVSVANTSVTTGTNVGLRVMAVSSLRFDDFTAGDVTAGVSVPLDRAAVTETAQALTGAKTASLGGGSATETAWPLTGSKTVLLDVALEAGTAQALAGVTSRTLGPAAGVETALPLAGAKTAVLGTAAETATARPLTSAGPGIDVDIDITVGPPHGAPYAVGPPQSSGWKAGAPC